MGISVSSANEPKSDADALALVGIKMMPAPAVVYRDFTSGMDDHMNLVIRFPKSRLAEFWKSSKWVERDAGSMKSADPRWQTLYERRIKTIGGASKAPILESLRKSRDGIFCDEPSGNPVGLKLFLSLDQDPDDVVAYIEWFEV